MTQVVEYASQLTKKVVVKLLTVWPLHRDACNMVADFRERGREKKEEEKEGEGEEEERGRKKRAHRSQFCVI